MDHFYKSYRLKRQIIKRCTRHDVVNNCTSFEQNKMNRGINWNCSFVEVLQVHPHSLTSALQSIELILILQEWLYNLMMKQEIFIWSTRKRNFRMSTDLVIPLRQSSPSPLNFYYIHSLQDSALEWSVVVIHCQEVKPKNKLQALRSSSGKGFFSVIKKSPNWNQVGFIQHWVNIEKYSE